METTRKSALEKGEKQYFTGVPCVQGHTANRRAKTGECLECRKLFLFKWRKKNPQKVKNHNQIQYTNHAEKLRERSRKYAQENAEYVRKRSREYQKNNLHIYAKSKAKRKAATLQRTPSWLTEDDLWMIGEAYELAALRTKMFGFVWHVDHKIPLQGKNVSGLHVPSNLQVIPASENIRKSNRYEVVT